MGFGRSCCKVFTVSLVPVTVLILSIAFFLGIVLLPALYTELATKEQYGIVIDAGSSHTHMYLYQWRVSPKNTTSQVQQITSCSPLGGGISTYSNVTAAGESIHLCLNGILKQVPKIKSYTTDVYVWFGATAGMRLLKLENATHSEEILKSVKKTLKDKKLHHHNVRILGGGEEGAAGWITTNYLENNLKLSYPTKRSLDSGTPSIGALDMGGASMQIAFQQVVQSVNHSFSARLFGQEWELYSRSYLCFGINEAFRRTLAYLVMEAGNDTSTVFNPCLPVGSNFTRNMSFLFTDHTCTNDLVPLDDYNDSTLIVFNGTSNPNECSLLLKKAMNVSRCFGNDSSIQDCSDDIVPSVTERRFLGFSEFYYITNFFNTSSLNGSIFSKYNDTVYKFCNRTWKDITKNHSTVLYLMDKCFQALYVNHMLQDGLGFTATGNWNITFTHEVNNIDAGWTLGYMLNRTNVISLTPFTTVYPYSSADLIVGMVVLTILTVVFIIFFIFTFSACRKALKPITTGYTNIS